jgi:MFS family permease
MRTVLGLTRDGNILFATRMVRLLAYGLLSVVLALYLNELGFTEVAIGLLFTLTLLGDTAISLWITTRADRVGRRRMLILGAGLMILAAALFALTRNPIVLVLAATVGVISPSGNEIGPFLPIEQASLSELVHERKRTSIFAWYNLVGSLATALGALIGGGLSQFLQSAGYSILFSYQVVILAYGAIGFLLVILFLRLSPNIEVAPVHKQQQEGSQSPGLGLHGSKQTVFRLAALFSLDAFAGGFVIQGLVALWFHQKFGVEPALLGAIFFGANLLAGISALSAARVATRIGLINTMVFTHLPSNILLMLVPLMPNLPLAIFVLLLRFSISQMDVPTRQAYTMAIVSPDERSAASGVTGVARSTGAALSPAIAGAFMTNPALLAAPFIISGALKIIYDLGLYFNFRTLKTPQEKLQVMKE